MHTVTLSRSALSRFHEVSQGVVASRRVRSRLLPRLAMFLVALQLATLPALARQLARTSLDSSGNEADGPSRSSVLSADGSARAFVSQASNLVAADTNSVRDVFVRDSEGAATVRVSHSSSGQQGNGASHSPSLSGTGRFVVFTSSASNLVPGDTNGVSDVFLHDRDPDQNGVFDEGNGQTSRVSVGSFAGEANGDSSTLPGHAISDDGRWIVFTSSATNLVMGDTNGAADVFLHDRVNGTVSRVSVDSFGGQANLGSGRAIVSGDGTVIAFESDAMQLDPLDTNGVTDVYVHERLSGLTTLASASASGQPIGVPCGSPALSRDGRVLAFLTHSPQQGFDVTGVSVRDRASGTTEVLLPGHLFLWNMWYHSQWGNWSLARSAPAVSADGSRVAFAVNEGGYASQSGLGVDPYFDAGATVTLRLHDRSTSTWTYITSGSSAEFRYEGTAIDWAPIRGPRLAASGRCLAFESDLPDLVDGDTNETWDTFAWRWNEGGPIGTRYCPAQPNSTGEIATLHALGLESLSARRLALRATSVPPGTTGMFFCGDAAASVPFGNGTLCVRGQVQRLPARLASPSGVLLERDVFAAPAPQLQLWAGFTYHFQAAFRDPASGSHALSFSDALSITFQP